MKIWREDESNIFKYFECFNDKLERRRYNVLPDMSVISLNASGISGKEDKLSFIKLASNELYLLFSSNNILKKYKFYLVANKEINDINSKVESYKKIWKAMNRDFNLESFNKGPEIKRKVGEIYYFSGIAEFNLENVSRALEIVSSNSRLNTIIISKANDLLTEEYIDRIFNILFNCKSEDMKEIDYYSLCVQCCNEGDIAIRWGTSFEECEIALIYNPKITNL